jgi:two-component system, NarL family, nitrate/nitrite response regulator NarL
LSVLVFTDEPALQIGLRSVFTEALGFGMAGVCPTASQFAGAARQHHPRVIIYSLALDPDLAHLSDVRRAAPESSIILWAREFSTELAHQAMELGVRGFLSTTAEPDMMLECVRFAATGEMWMERSLANTLLHWRPVGLSRRQSQLLSLLVQGLKNREIAAELGISEGTVKAYLTTLFEKVGARDRFELALYGLKNLRNTREAEAGRDLRMRSQVRARGRSSARPGTRTA